MAAVYDSEEEEEAPPPPPSHPHPDDVKAVTELVHDKEEAPKANDLEDGQSFEIPPTRVVHRMEEAEENHKFRNRRRTTIYAALIVLFAITIAIILGVGFGTGSFQGGKSSSSSQANAPPPPPPSPPDSPTSNPAAPSSVAPSPVTPIGREQAFIDYLSTVSVNGEDSFQDPKSGEVLAMQWLANNDTLMLDPSDPDSQQQINQRYALATLFLSSSSTLKDDTNWLNEDECTWAGVSCDSAAETQRRRRGQSQGTTPLVSSIDLSSNSYSGTLPADFSLLTFLTSIDLSANSITGTFDSINWTTFAKLTELNVSDNAFSGSLGTNLFQVVSLQKIILSKNAAIVGTIPATIANLVNLQIFQADGTGLKGSIPPAIGLVQQLTTFDITLSTVTGTIPTEIGKLQSLLVFAVDDNKLTGTIPVEVSNMMSLVEFRCFGNRLSGAINGIFGGLSNLRKFRTVALLNREIDGGLTLAFLPQKLSNWETTFSQEPHR